MKRPADFMVAPRETIAGPGHMPATKTRVIFFKVHVNWLVKKHDASMAT